MAGEWLKFEVNTPEKREVFSITTAMGWDDPDLTVGKLLKVWRWFDQQTVDGNAGGVTLALLDRIIGVSGFAQAMCDVGWLRLTETGLALPNFDRHNGKTAKARALTVKRVAKHKANAGANDDGNDDGNADGVTKPLPRKEKKRKDKDIPPIPPEGGETAKVKSIVFADFLARCKERGESPIPEDHSVFAYAAEAKVPRDFLALHWFEFKDRYSDATKKYKDWRKVFSNSVRGNWFQLWYAPKDGGEYQLTTKGIQAQHVHGDKLK